jgi:hypothetical protein
MSGFVNKNMEVLSIYHKLIRLLPSWCVVLFTVDASG